MNNDNDNPFRRLGRQDPQVRAEAERAPQEQRRDPRDPDPKIVEKYKRRREYVNPLSTVKHLAFLRQKVQELGDQVTPNDIAAALLNIAPYERCLWSTKYVSSCDWIAHIVGLLADLKLCKPHRETADGKLHFGVSPEVEIQVISLLKFGYRDGYLSLIVEDDHSAQAILDHVVNRDQDILFMDIYRQCKADPNKLVLFEECADEFTLLIDRHFRGGIASLIEEMLRESRGPIPWLADKVFRKITPAEWLQVYKTMYQQEAFTLRRSFYTP